MSSGYEKRSGPDSPVRIFHQSVVRLGRRASKGNVSSWIAGTAVAIFSWYIVLVAPAGGLEASWGTGLFMATEEGLRFGKEVVFTYGPLGFLRTSRSVSPGVVSPELASLGWFYQAFLFVLVCVGIVELLRRSAGVWIASALTVVVLSFFPAALVEMPIVLAVIGCMLALRRNPTRGADMTLIYGGAVLVAVELLVKASTGPLVAVIILLGLVGLAPRWRHVIGFSMTCVASLLLLIAITGQVLSDLPDFIRYSLEISSGYREAMTLADLPNWYVLLAAMIGAAVLVATYRGEFRDTRGRWCAVLLILLMELVLFKHATWRYGLGHLSPAIATLLLVWLAIPRRPGPRDGLIGITVLFVFTSFYVLSLGGLTANINPIANARSFVTNLRTAVDPGRQQRELAAGQQALIGGYDLDPRLLSAVEGRQVLVGPSEIAMAWAYDFDWSPVPVFQDYSAYTKELDELNASVIADPNGPERIIRPAPRPETWFSQTPDGRMPAWDPPKQQREIYCHFRRLAMDSRWEVLERIPDRCGPLQPIESIQAKPGETVRVPDPGDNAVTVLRLYGAGVEGLETIWSLVGRVKSRFVVVNGDEGRPYRLVPGTATDGLMMRGGVRTGGDLPFEIPQARTIAVGGVSRELQFEFLRMPVAIFRPNTQTESIR